MTEKYEYCSTVSRTFVQECRSLLVVSAGIQELKKQAKEDLYFDNWKRMRSLDFTIYIGDQFSVL